MIGRLSRVKHFSFYDDIRTEMEEASIIFLLPHQLALMPDKQYEMCMNISSFGEMKKEQLDWYFNQLDRLISQYFYTKQWKVSKNPYDGIELSQADYPFARGWRKLYSRNCSVQSKFFEAMYKLEVA